MRVENAGWELFLSGANKEIVLKAIIEELNAFGLYEFELSRREHLFLLKLFQHFHEVLLLH